MELQLINDVTLDLAPRAQEIVHHWGTLDRKVQPEILQSMIEMNSGIHNSVLDVESDLRQVARRLAKICRSCKVRLASNGTHPTAHHSQRRLYPMDRYFEIVEKNQYVARRLMIFGLHVHIGVASGEHCIQLLNRMMYWLPIFLAISSSSPFYEGIDTGLASCRTTMFEALPTGGHPCAIRNWKDYVKLVSTLHRSGSISSLKDIWWDIRPSPAYGTLEIRICDGMPSISLTSALAALIHTVCLYTDQHLSKKFRPLSDWYIRENKWRAARHGLEAEILINEDGDKRPMVEEILERLDDLGPIASRYGYLPYFDLLRSYILEGGSYKKQRSSYAGTQNFRTVIQGLIDEFETDLIKPSSRAVG